METTRKPDVFAYTNYRDYLRELYAYTKKAKRGFTYRSFAQAAGYKSPSILKDVIAGHKNIPVKNFRSFIAPFALSKKEENYLELLVRFAAEKNEDKKSACFRKIIRQQRAPRSHNITPPQYSYYAKWYYAVVRDLAAITGFKEDPAWIAAHISPEITPDQAQEALDLLLDLGFLVRDAGGTLVQDVPKLTVDPDAQIQAIRDLARRSIEMQWEAIERFAPENREMSGLTMHMSENCFRDVKEMVRKSQDDILEYVSKHPEASDMVCQLNFGLFPHMKRMEKKGGGAA